MNKTKIKIILYDLMQSTLETFRQNMGKKEKDQGDVYSDLAENYVKKIINLLSKEDL